MSEQRIYIAKNRVNYELFQSLHKDVIEKKFIIDAISNLPVECLRKLVNLSSEEFESFIEYSCKIII